MTRRLLAVAFALVLALAGEARAESDVPAVPWGNDFKCAPSAEHPRPVVLLHGLSANAERNWSYVGPALQAEGYCVFALTYGMDEQTRGFAYRPGGTIRAEDSAVEIRRFVRRVRRATDSRRVDFVGHSEGTVTPRWYLEKLDGARRVKRYVALTPLWRGTEVGGTALFRDAVAPFGLSQPVIDAFSAFCAFCPQALRGSDYLDELNADGERIPGIKHTNIVTRYDELVVPFTSGIMQDGGRNFVLQDVCPANISEHLAVAFDPAVLRLILNGLKPAEAEPVSC